MCYIRFVLMVTLYQSYTSQDFNHPILNWFYQEEWGGNCGCYWLDKKARVEVSSGTFMKYIEDANDLASLVSWI